LDDLGCSAASTVPTNSVEYDYGFAYTHFCLVAKSRFSNSALHKTSGFPPSRNDMPEADRSCIFHWGSSNMACQANFNCRRNFCRVVDPEHFLVGCRPSAVPSLFFTCLGPRSPLAVTLVCSLFVSFDCPFPSKDGPDKNPIAEIVPVTREEDYAICCTMHYYYCEEANAPLAVCLRELPFAIRSFFYVATPCSTISARLVLLRTITIDFSISSLW